MKSRIFRAVVCFILVCCLVINMSPIKAEAFVLTATTAVSSAGVLAFLEALGMGIVATEVTVDLLNSMGIDLKENARELYGEASQVYLDFTDWLNGLEIGNELEDFVLSVPERFRSIVQDWGAGLIKGEGIEVEGEAAPDGYAYYNGVLLPIVPECSAEGYPYQFLHISGDYYVFVYSSVPIYYDSSSSSYPYRFDCSGNPIVYYYKCPISNPTYWTPETFSTYSASFKDLLLDNCGVVGGDISDAQTTVIEPAAILGEKAQGIQDGTKTADDLVLPDINLSNIFEGQTDALEALNQWASQLANGTITHEEYLTKTGVTTADPDAGTDTESGTTDLTGTLAGTSVETFFNKLVAILSVPFEWIWGKIEALFGPWIDSIGMWFSEIGAKIEAIPGAFVGWFENIISGIEAIPGAFSGWFDNIISGIEAIPGAFSGWFATIISGIEAIPGAFSGWFDNIISGIEAIPGAFSGWFSDIIEGVLSIPASIADVFSDVIAGVIALPNIISDTVSAAAQKVEEAVKSLVVPDEDYLTDKVDALCAEFVFAGSIVRTGQAIGTGLAGVSTEPPVIYIDLGAARGSYNIGGTVPFLDLRWYAEYKPTVDIIISAFLWICFVWRMLLKLPGIISGMPGDFTMASAHTMGLSDMLPSRSAEYEQLRIESRESIRKGRL